MQFLCRRMVKGLRTVTFRWENATMLRRVFGIRHGRRGVSAKSRFADSGRSVINDNCLLVLLASRFCERLRTYRVSCATSGDGCFHVNLQNGLNLCILVEWEITGFSVISCTWSSADIRFIRFICSNRGNFIYYFMLHVI